MDSLLPLPDQTTLRKALAEPVSIVLKHSPICGVSTAAHREVQRFAGAHHDVPCYVVNVFTARSIARQMAADTGIAHASPQALLFRNGKVEWVASHYQVTAEALEDAIAKGATQTGSV